MFPGLAAHFHNRADFLAGVLCVIIVKNIFVNGKIILTFGAVHILLTLPPMGVHGIKSVAENMFLCRKSTKRQLLKVRAAFSF